MDSIKHDDNNNKVELEQMKKKIKRKRIDESSSKR